MLDDNLLCIVIFLFSNGDPRSGSQTQSGELILALIRKAFALAYIKTKHHPSHMQNCAFLFIKNEAE